MKISISNIAWNPEYDTEMYAFLRDNGVHGLEIAPTRIFPENPYDKIHEAGEYRKMLYERYGLEVSSMQSIWFGRNEKIFEDKRQRQTLLEYTHKAFVFANALECRNLVFGCPKNRNINSEDDWKVAEEFFARLGELATEEGAVLALEANPTIYGTNFLNTTWEAYALAEKLSSPGIKVNYDLGTVIQNEEEIQQLEEMLPEISHVHVSEPNLAVIKYNELHEELTRILKKNSYSGFISIEMKNPGNIGIVKDIVNILLEKE